MVVIPHLLGGHTEIKPHLDQLCHPFCVTKVCRSLVKVYSALQVKVKVCKVLIRLKAAVFI